MGTRQTGSHHHGNKPLGLRSIPGNYVQCLAFCLIPSGCSLRVSSNEFSSKGGKKSFKICSFPPCSLHMYFFLPGRLFHAPFVTLTRVHPLLQLNAHFLTVAPAWPDLRSPIVRSHGNWHSTLRQYYLGNTRYHYLGNYYLFNICVPD